MPDPFKNIDKDLLTKQRESLKGVLNKNEPVDPETLQGVLGLLDAVTDNIDTINNTELCTCEDCGYIGNTAIWKGHAYYDTGQVRTIKGPVRLVGGTFEVDDIIEIEDHSGFDGDYFCPFCQSSNIY